MQIDVVTLFPELFSPFLETSLVGRATSDGVLVARTRSPRQFGIGRHLKVDDTPYGGGAGMVMRVDCIVACMESLDEDRPGARRAHRVLLTPQGRRLSQGILRDLSEKPCLTLVCGRYEGFDERVRSFVDEEISLGDFVLTGGEVAAMALIEGVIRLVPGVLGNDESATLESHSPDSQGMLEYPQYTRPTDFRGMTVPEILMGGNHGEIARYRHEQAYAKTRDRRPDLLPRETPAQAAPISTAGTKVKR